MGMDRLQEMLSFCVCRLQEVCGCGCVAGMLSGGREGEKEGGGVLPESSRSCACLIVLLERMHGCRGCSG